MSYTNANWTCVSASLNQGQETVTPYGGSPTVLNAPNLFIYGSPTDALATIAAANYFLAEYASLSVGDVIIVNGTDGSNMYIVATSTSTGVTVDSFTTTGSVATANIQNNAVTYAKIQQSVGANTLLGNPTGGAANFEEVTLGNGLDFASTVLELKPSYLNVVEVSLTAAQFNGMYATPVSVIAAPGANKAIIVNHAVLNMTYGAAQFAAGGAVGLQYGSTAHLAGAPASATEAATDFTGASASTLFRFGAGLSTGAAVSAAANAAVYISNATAAFTTGDSTFNLWIWYEVIPTNS